MNIIFCIYTVSISFVLLWILFYFYLASEPNHCDIPNGVLQHKKPNKFEIKLSGSNCVKYDTNLFISTCKKEAMKVCKHDFESFRTDMDASLKNTFSKYCIKVLVIFIYVQTFNLYIVSYAYDDNKEMW